MKVNAVDHSGKKASTKVELNDDIWNIDMNQDLVAQVVNVQIDSQRKGAAHTKSRGEVSGGGRKPWKQKGTGRARHGSIRSPLWRKGGVAFGPKSYKKFKSVPKKMARLALRCVLSDQAHNQKVIVVSDLEQYNGAKTKDMQKLFENIGVDKSKVMVIVPSESKSRKQMLAGSRNLDYVTLSRVMDVNTYDVMNARVLVIAPESAKEFESRLLKKE